VRQLMLLDLPAQHQGSPLGGYMFAHYIVLSSQTAGIWKQQDSGIFFSLTLRIGLKSRKTKSRQNSKNVISDKIKILAQYWLPQHLVSRLAGRFAAARAGKLTTLAINWFIRQYGINMAEAQQEQADAYSTFNDFFTRPLKPGMREIAPQPASLVFPADGAISQFGGINKGRLIQAKNHDYTASALLGGDPLSAEAYRDGSFITIYLSPRDYHRVHMPVSGTLTEMVYVPGKLFSVNPLTAENVPDLFAVNERVVCQFDTEFGPMAMVLVGATIVASIETVWSGTVTPPTAAEVQRWQYPASGPGSVKLEKGAEMGRFKLGSTVILLFGKDAIQFSEQLENQQTTRMGQLMAQGHSSH